MVMEITILLHRSERPPHCYEDPSGNGPFGLCYSGQVLLNLLVTVQASGFVEMSLLFNYLPICLTICLLALKAIIR